MRRKRLVFAPHDPQAPPTYLLLNESGEPVGRGAQPLQAEPPTVPTDVVLVVPGVEAVARWLRLPGRNDAQSRAAAALLLEDERALGDEALHLALGPPGADGERLVVAVSAARMQAWLDLARLHGLEPAAVVPDHLLLPEPEDEEPVAVMSDGLLVARGRRIAFACEPDLAPVLLDGRAARRIDEPEAVEQLWAAGASQPAVDLLQGDFAPSDGRRPEPRMLRRAAVLAGLLLLSPVALNGADAMRLNLAAGKAEAAATRAAAAVLPKGTAVSDPAAQAAAQLERMELASGGGPAGLAAQLFRALSEIDQAQVESLTVSDDGAMRVSINHVNYSDMELLRDALRRAGVAFREEGTREEAGRIVSDIILGVRP